MDQLTPELERRIQVEELWARRNVLSDLMNQERLERHQAKRLLMCLNRTLAAEPPKKVRQAEAPSTPNRQRGWMGQQSLVQGLWGAAAALLVVIIATAEPQASALHQRVRQALAGPASVAATPASNRAERARKTDIAVDAQDESAPLFPDLHHEAVEKVSQRLPRP
jgi:hypothetical protein